MLSSLAATLAMGPMYWRAGEAVLGSRMAVKVATTSAAVHGAAVMEHDALAQHEGPLREIGRGRSTIPQIGLGRHVDLEARQAA